MVEDIEKLTLKGINGATGGYLLPEMTPRELFKAAKGETPDRDHLYDEIYYMPPGSLEEIIEAGY